MVTMTVAVAVVIYDDESSPGGGMSGCAMCSTGSTGSTCSIIQQHQTEEPTKPSPIINLSVFLCCYYFCIAICLAGSESAALSLLVETKYHIPDSSSCNDD